MPPSTPSSVLEGIETSICRQYDEHSTHTADTHTTADGEYTAVVDQPALPGAMETTTLRVCRGAVVDLSDRWAFFDDLAPAAAFVRAGRTSNMMSSWDLFEAAEVRAFCARHHREEVALLLGRQVYERSEIHAHAARFAATTSPLGQSRPGTAPDIVAAMSAQVRKAVLRCLHILRALGFHAP